MTLDLELDLRSGCHRDLFQFWRWLMSYCYSTSLNLWWTITIPIPRDLRYLISAEHNLPVVFELTNFTLDLSFLLPGWISDSLYWAHLWIHSRILIHLILLVHFYVWKWYQNLFVVSRGRSISYHSVHHILFVVAFWMLSYLLDRSLMTNIRISVLYSTSQQIIKILRVMYLLWIQGWLLVVSASLYEFLRLCHLLCFIVSWLSWMFQIWFQFDSGLSGRNVEFFSPLDQRCLSHGFLRLLHRLWRPYQWWWKGYRLALCLLYTVFANPLKPSELL